MPSSSAARLPAMTPLAHAGLAVFLVLLALELGVFRLLLPAELRLADVHARRHAAETVADPSVVVIDIDDASMQAMQDIAGLWAWPREIHADLLEALAGFEPRAVVFDMTFSERDLRRPKSDARLGEALGAFPRTYLAAAQLPPSPVDAGLPLTGLADAFGVLQPGAAATRAVLQLPHAVDPVVWRLGLGNSIEDADGVLRRQRVYTDIEGWRLPSLAARVARDLGAALPEESEILLRWPGTGRTRYAYGELYRLLTEARLTAAESAQLDALFRDRIVVIGASATGAFDHHLTPLGAGYPGVDILALAIDNLVNGNSLRMAPPWVPFMFGALLLGALAVAFARRVNPIWSAFGLAATSVVLVLLAGVAYGRGVVLPVVAPLAAGWAWFLGAAVSGFLRERRAREQAVGLFARFLNPAIVRRIVDQGETVESLSGRMQEVTVLFSDIRGFTTLSETRSPHEVVHLLNRYFERQVEVIFRHGGTLDKFIGDAIMAFWGAPIDDPRHARNAVLAALEMQDVLLAFKAELEREEGSGIEFDVGIGVHTGLAVVGFIGAQRKLDYTAIGDTVNLASRVEGLTKGVARILVTQQTLAACAGAKDEQPTPELRFEPRGSFEVKGRVQPVQVFEPVKAMLDTSRLARYEVNEGEGR